MGTVIYMVTAALVLAAIFLMACAQRQKFIVPEGHYGLLYRDGKYRHRISPGKHCFWSRKYSVRLVDMRKTLLTIESGEVRSADLAHVKISAVLTYEIIQAETAIQAVPDYISCLEQAVRAALASVIAAMPVAVLLGQRLDIDAQLFARVLPEADEIGIVVHAVEVKEVLLPSGIKYAWKSPKPDGSNHGSTCTR